MLAKEKDVGYTSALKLLQIMTTKGIVTRTEEQRAHVYSANQPAEKTKQQFAADVLQRVFRGSASQLMQHVLSGKRSSKKRSTKSAACSTNTRGSSHDRLDRFPAHAGAGRCCISSGRAPPSPRWPPRCMFVFRQPATRYLVGVGALALMLVSFASPSRCSSGADGRKPPNSAARAPAAALASPAGCDRDVPVDACGVASGQTSADFPGSRASGSSGVFVFALRIVFGLFVIEQLRRRSLVRCRTRSSRGSARLQRTARHSPRDSLLRVPRASAFPPSSAFSARSCCCPCAR